MHTQEALTAYGRTLLHGHSSRCLMNSNTKSNEEALKEWKEKEKLLDIERKEKRLYEEKLKAQLEEQVQTDPNNIDLLLRLALFELEPPEGDPDKCIEYLNRVLSLDENNATALLFFAHLHEYVVWFIPDELLAKIETLYTDNDEYNSMLKYVASWSYGKFRKNIPEKEEALLKESIKLYSRHVWNYVNLAELYAAQGKITESQELAKKALSNVKKVYSCEVLEYDPTNITDFLNAEIKRIYLTDVQFGLIKKLVNQ